MTKNKNPKLNKGYFIGNNKLFSKTFQRVIWEIAEEMGLVKLNKNGVPYWYNPKLRKNNG